jgi:iron complex outermembrane receptor protein
MIKKLLLLFISILFSIYTFGQDTLPRRKEVSLVSIKTYNDSITKEKANGSLGFCSVKGVPIKYTTLSEVIISNYHVSDSLMNAPASLSVLSSADLQRNNNSDISASLNTVAGVLMQSGAINTNRISIRGIGARTPYGTNKIRAFYGSIPLTSGDSETTIEDIDLEIIDQTEIIKGPLSSVYGAGLGGAILIKPKQLRAPGSEAYTGTTVGSFGLVKNTVRYSYDSTFGSLNLSYHKLETDGWRNNSAYNREGVTLAGELFRKQNSKLTYFGNYTYMKAYIPSSISKQAFDNNPRSAAPTWAAAKGYEQYDSYMGGLAYDWQLAPWLKNTTSIFVNAKNSYEPRPFDILTQDNTAFGGRSQFFGDFKLGKMKSQFIAGMEYFKDGFKG